MNRRSSYSVLKLNNFFFFKNKIQPKFFQLNYMQHYLNISKRFSTLVEIANTISKVCVAAITPIIGTDVNSKLKVEHPTQNTNYL